VWCDYGFAEAGPTFRTSLAGDPLQSRPVSLDSLVSRLSVVVGTLAFLTGDAMAPYLADWRGGGNEE